MASSTNSETTPAAAPDDGAAASADLIGMLDAGRRRFLALVEQVRPELHRYCARMTGTVADGEDVVQETLARAYYELSQMTALPPLRPWLFRIAHNRAIDHWRHESYRISEPLDAAHDVAADAGYEPDNRLARDQAVRAAISCFLELAPAQRGCVILKDVLDHTLDEIAIELNLSVPAVKAALHRGRAALQRAAAAPGRTASVVREVSPALRRYATLFNAHDWDGVRALLADDVQLDLVSRRKAAGRREVGRYLGNYERAGGWRAEPGWVDGREVLAIRVDGPAAARYFIALEWVGELVSTIRDFRYVPYIVRESDLLPAR
jgi:RNA polymerase sigma factor (sigma-70 family)